MRSLTCLVLAVVVAVAGPVLSACSSIPDLDSLSEMWETKKKLAGERKPVFPDGVPGVSSGVPPELVRGYREPESGRVDPARVAAEEAAGEGDAKPRKPPSPQQRTAAAKPKPKPKPAADSSAQAQRQPPPAAQPAPWTPQQQPPAWPGR
jgi:hypothetical protein